MNCGHVFETMDNVLFLIYLVWISYQDLSDMKVVRYAHLLGAVAIGCAVSVNGVESILVWELLLSFLLQITGYYCNCYGLADVIAVCICMTFYCAKSGGECCLLFYLVMQVVSGMTLILVQLMKSNLKGLKLKKPVPYIPYISIAFFLTKWVI